MGSGFQSEIHSNEVVAINGNDHKSSITSNAFKSSSEVRTYSMSLEVYFYNVLCVQVVLVGKVGQWGKSFFRFVCFSCIFNDKEETKELFPCHLNETFYRCHINIKGHHDFFIDAPPTWKKTRLIEKSIHTV